MILCAPNVYVAQYFKETGQAKPEVMARSETLMLTGYQRELTFRRKDASFSAFGNSDPQGSLWLSAFVLRTFAQARPFIYIDEQVLSATQGWLRSLQKPDGSFEPVGFVHHQDLLGGLSGTTALTAYLATALLESGDNSGAAKALAYLEKVLPDTTEPYSLALGAYALHLGQRPLAASVTSRLLGLAQTDNDSLFWTARSQGGPNKPDQAPANAGAAIETTGYALLALLAQGDRISAGKAARYLVGQRNALGGWNSTQDTIIGLQALARYVAAAKTEVNAAVSFSAAEWRKELKVGPDNYDVLQMVETPAGPKVQVEVSGQGQALLQAVRRYNLPQAAPADRAAFQLSVGYGAAPEVPVNSQLTIQSLVQFTPPAKEKAGMTVVEVALPTGFSAVEESLKSLVQNQPRLKRYDLSGRKVQLYLDDLEPDEKLGLEFKATANFPVKAQAVTSQVYAYYRPEWQGEYLGGAIEVVN
jgi:CD109 antigen